MPSPYVAASTLGDMEPPRSPSPARSERSLHSLGPIGVHPCETEPSGLPRYYAMSRTPSADAPLGEEAGESVPLLSRHGADGGKWYRGPLFMTGVKLSILFAVFSALVLGTFWFGMPNVEPEDRPALKLPRSFADLQGLNALLKKYKDLYPWRIMLCGVVAYLYVQAFTFPGSMYISILFGAAYGILPGLLLSCLCDSSGSILCYTLSSFLGPPLLELPYYRRMLEKWRKKIMGDPEKGTEAGKDSVFAFLLVLRILPLPPHWIANFVAPHLGIGMGMFWLTCFLGICPVSVIHVMIGSSLDQMTSAEDFQILSARNILGMAAVIVAVLIPVGLKRVFKTDFGDLNEQPEGIALDADAQAVEFDEHGLPKRTASDSGVTLAGPSQGEPHEDSVATGRRSILPPMPGTRGKGKGKGRALLIDVVDDDDDPGGSAYELGTPEPTPPAAGPAKKGLFKPLRGIRGYGTIDIDPAEPRPEASSSWWRLR
ncbi:hypothetical protein CcaverHIS002_0702730 [Cutaneotrichosporon cavernicola]|nr:hypothetical protein CcaverHIS002_0702730 [Cutaneotrichosporon cavernicola]